MPPPDRLDRLDRPRNHAQRVKDLQALHNLNVIRFVQSDRLPGRPTVYTIEFSGDRLDLPVGKIDAYITAWRQALVLFGRWGPDSPHPSSPCCAGAQAGAAGAGRDGEDDTADDTADDTERYTHAHRR